MSRKVYVYLCTNGSCRNVERRAGVRYSQIDCPICGSLMRLTDTEDMD